MRRPLVCKIHRGVLFSPQSDTRSLKRLHDAWGLAIRDLFFHYTPLVIGYSGLDDTLMALLESIEPSDINGKLIWCYHESSRPNERTMRLVASLDGVIVAIPDFDLLMVLLGDRMGITLLDEELELRAKKRIRRYQSRIRQFDTVKYPSVRTALYATFERSGGWFAWYQMANQEADPSRREAVLRQGLEQYPDCPELHSNLANLVCDIKEDREEAERLFRNAVALAPERKSILNNFAEFLLVGGKIDESSGQLENIARLKDGKEPMQVTAHLALLRAVIVECSPKSDPGVMKV